MREPQPRTIHLEDYTQPAFLIDSIELDIDLRPEDALVKARQSLRRNARAADPRAPLALDGEELELVSVALDGTLLRANAYAVTPERLTIAQVPEAFSLETVSRLLPQKNTRLEGLYATKNGFVTQCEADGFRRITWYLDRPDVLAKFTTTIHADGKKCPVLLSNGNRVGSGEEPGGRHWARFEDPFPKPSYLFAMVAAELEALKDEIVSKSGKRKKLFVYVEPGRLDQAGWAMDCLKRAIRWDERRFGLELDLDEYKIVAVGDFNSGAMENKGLNLFNTKYVLARADTATDFDYLNIDRVVAHEYFHNWTGNRVTCRDWFQLSLKEGLTVFRDQEYGADTYSRAVTRIQEVRGLRAAQFPEDAGPMAHPVRPQSYMEVRNFYTSTVYEKGAEVVRMQHTLLGEEKFQAGMRLYFQRHDGQAVTCDDFVQAMQDASGVDLAQFRRWYDVAGTPVLDCTGTYAGGTFTLMVKQSMSPPFHVPLAVKVGAGERMLSVTKPEENFVFGNLTGRPIASLLRRFSAPVILSYPYTEDELVHLMAHDDDPFNRWEAGQRLAASIILEKGGVPSAAFIEAIRRLLSDPDPAFAAEALNLPSETFLAEKMDVVDPDRLHESRNRLRRELAGAIEKDLLERYEALANAGPYSPDPASMGRRALRNACLSYLSELGAAELCRRQYAGADNMTDAMAALGCLANLDCAERQPALDSFYAKWKDEPLVVDKWFAVQASSRLPSTLARVQELLGHPAFDLRVPNKVYALIRGFAANHVRFHAADGSGYAFLADQVLALNATNPMVAARLARGFDRWRKFDPGRQARARAQLERMRDAEGLSKDVSEIVIKSLA
ncbi:MAG: aminopeptidase N [Betaproteobacteria bacterium RIFCSPLOWO2_12_FULL_68_20]|nr:MAG: aminopeptidase N [Betaproteobacteria bacterium RIFCSPLOWO2_12_FULL_68_20]